MRLRDLDRDRLYVLAYSVDRCRWETVGVVTDPEAVAPLPVSDDGASAGGASRVAGPGRHVAPDR